LIRTGGKSSSSVGQKSTFEQSIECDDIVDKRSERCRSVQEHQVSSEEISPLEGATKPERSMRQTLAIAAISLAVILGIYAYVGTRDQSLDIAHAALLFEEQLDGLVCCSVYHETGDAEYLLVITRELGREFRQVILRVMQLDEEGRPEEINAIGSPFDSLLPTSFAVVEDVVHIPLFGDAQAGVWSIDVSHRAWPESIGFVHTGAGFSRQLAASDEGLVAINHTEKIVLVDVSNPHDSDIVSQMEQPVSGSIGLQLNDARLYVNDGDADVIRIVDVSDWFAPMEVGSPVNPDGPGEVPIELGVLDAAERLDATAIPGRFLDFAVDGELLYVAASDLGLNIIDETATENTQM
jgi:hypothetical protein